MPNSRAHIVISGHVQGVFFRAHTRDIAQKFNIRGWVKNRPDGAVEAVLEGNDEDVVAVIEWCHDGPRGASVSRVDVEHLEYTGEFKGFEICY